MVRKIEEGGATEAEKWMMVTKSEIWKQTLYLPPGEE